MATESVATNSEQLQPKQASSVMFDVSERLRVLKSMLRVTADAAMGANQIQEDIAEMLVLAEEIVTEVREQCEAVMGHLDGAATRGRAAA